MPLNISDERLSKWAEDDMVSTEIAKEMAKAYFRDNRFLILAGKGDSRGIKTKVLNDLSPFRCRMRTALTGKGVKGNTDLDQNRDEIQYYTTTANSELYRNSVKSEHRAYLKTREIDFIRDTSEDLKDWLSHLIEKQMAATLVNNFTNVVLADKAGVKAPATKGTSVKTYSNTLSKGDVLNVATIKRAIAMAKNGLSYDGSAGFSMRPLAFEVVNEKGFSYKDEVYVLFINYIQAEQLKRDPEWKEMQKIDKRGDTNRLFTGAIGSIENCVVVEIGEWRNDNILGLPSSDFNQADFQEYVQNDKPMLLSDYKGKDTETCMGVLIGAGALIYGSDSTPKVIIDEADSGTKIVMAIENIISISKTRYDLYGSFQSIAAAQKSKLEAYDGKDFAVIGVLSAKE